jgi:hypothetical protein
MANLPAMRSMFGRLGLSPEAAHFMVHDQSIDTLAILTRLDDEQIDKLCSICRKPGGQIRHPNAGLQVQGAVAGVVHADVYANPGISVAALHAENIKLAAFHLRLMTNVSRQCDVGDITIANIERARNYKIEMEAHENLKLTDAPVLKVQKVFEFFTELREFAFDMQGEVSKIPIAYVIREHEEALPELTEPSFGAANSPFQSFNQELVARAPIYTTDAAGNRILCHHYSLDRVTMWKILYQICSGTMYYSYIRQYQASRDGRSAFFALYTALLGSQAVANYASTAENRLQTLSLTGQKAKNWGFEKYVLSHMDQHTTLEKLTEHGHNGIDETSKIRHFSRGITDPELETVKSSVCANQQLDTFDKVVATYRTFIESKKHHTRESKISVNVSQIGTTSRNGGGNRTQQIKKTGPEDDGYDASTNYSAHKVDPNKYYNTNDWNNSLNKNQRNYLRQNSRGASKRKSRSSGGTSNTSEVKTEALKQMQKKQKVMEATIASLQASQALNEVDSDGMDVSSEDDVPRKKKSKNTKPLQIKRKTR